MTKDDMLLFAKQSIKAWKSINGYDHKEWSFENLAKYMIIVAEQIARQEAIGFAEWIAKEDLKMYAEGWCQLGGSNGFHYTTEQLYDLYLKSKI